MAIVDVEKINVHQLRKEIKDCTRQRYPLGGKNYNWKAKPTSWPDDVPFLDPNNINKDLKRKPNKDELELMYKHLMKFENVEPKKNALSSSNHNYISDGNDDRGLWEDEIYEFSAEVLDNDDWPPRTGEVHEEKTDENVEVDKDSINWCSMHKDQVLHLEGGPLQCSEDSDPDQQFFDILMGHISDYCFIYDDVVTGFDNEEDRYRQTLFDLETLNILERTFELDSEDIIRESSIIIIPDLLSASQLDGRSGEWTTYKGADEFEYFSTKPCEEKYMDTTSTREQVYEGTLIHETPTEHDESYRKRQWNADDFFKDAPPQKRARHESAPSSDGHPGTKLGHLEHDIGLDPTKKKPPRRSQTVR